MLKFKQGEDGMWISYRTEDVKPVQEPKQPEPDESPYKRRKIKEPDEQQGNE